MCLAPVFPHRSDSRTTGDPWWREAPSVLGDPALFLLLQTPTLLQTPRHSEAQKIKGPVTAAFLTLGKPNAHFTQTSQSGAMTLQLLAHQFKEPHHIQPLSCPRHDSVSSSFPGPPKRKAALAGSLGKIALIFSLCPFLCYVLS